MDASQERIDHLFAAQKQRFEEKGPSTAEERIAALERLKTVIVANRAELRRAVHEDFRKPAAEVDTTELFVVTSEIRHAVRHLRGWMRPRRVGSPLAFFGTRSTIHYEPKGVVLIVAPWNFPFNLSLGPLVCALAAGNAAILKPSELTPHTSTLIARLIAEVFDEDQVAVVEGGVEASKKLLALPFDHIFFTGSTRVGGLVMKAAAEHLSSVTLELGGKSPVVVDATAAIEDAGEKIVWGKFVNCGQTCIAPDYVLVERSRAEALLEAIKAALERHYPGGEAGRKQTPDLARIITAEHHERLCGLLKDAVERGARIVVGGGSETADRYLAPTVLAEVSPQSDILQEEIFGPLLPVLVVDDLEAAAAFIRAKPKPLAMYIFSRSSDNVDFLLSRTSAGGTCINETLVHYLQTNLPFGGVNQSGVGKSHGFWGFETFSNPRAVLRQRTWLSTFKTIYPPYGKRTQRIIDIMLRFL